jgi:hypothetical protein
MPEKQGVHSWTSALSQIQIFADAGPKRLVVRQGAVKGRVRHMTGIRCPAAQAVFLTGAFVKTDSQMGDINLSLRSRQIILAALACVIGNTSLIVTMGPQFMSTGPQGAAENISKASCRGAS